MWLPLAEYSMKHKVSISTLRRRIKAEDIQYRLEDGKYFIFDTGSDVTPAATTTTFAASKATSGVENKSVATEAHRPSLKRDASEVTDQKSEKVEGESVITAANRLLTDLKKAYTQVLHEKEEQIVSLKREISDLRTLVRVLETENDRLAEQDKRAQPYSSNYSSNRNLDY
jgi:hypothetical protein